jgi:hypothetical protein
LGGYLCIWWSTIDRRWHWYDGWWCCPNAISSANRLASKQSADNRASYAFGGVTNTAAQGYPVPLLYGRRRIGGAIISAGIYVEDQQ